MTAVHVDITMSLDGFIAGPGDEIDPLHDWLYDLASFKEMHGDSGGRHDRDSEILAEAMQRNGVLIVGRRMYEVADGWGDNPPFHVPVFVLTHERREPLARAGGTTFIFVTEGIEHALGEARAAAGDRDVSIAGGANTIQQFLAAGLIDELQLHIAPVLLGRGISLFDQVGSEQMSLQIDRVIESPAVTHLRYRIVRPGGSS